MTHASRPWRWQRRLFVPALGLILVLAVIIPSSSVEAASFFTETKKLTQASPTPGGPGWFGWDVDISGDTAIGSAREPFRFLPPGTVGSASIFERNLGGPNNWGERVKLVPPGSGDIGSVAIDGDIAVVGRDFENSREGAAYIYGRNVGGPDNWGLITRIEDPDGRQNCCDGFGSAVAVSGDTIAVGEFWADRVHLFERNEGGPDNWGYVKLIKASDDTGTFDFFFSVSVEGDALVVGSGNHTHAGGLPSAGAVYIFERNEGGPNNWGEVMEIFASDAAAVDQFGMTTALSGDTLIAGTSGANNTAAYVFERNAGGPNNWGEVKKLVGSDVLSGPTAVGISGDIAVLGHSGHIHPTPPSWGTAFVFERNEGGPNNWGQTQELIPSDPGDVFGGSVAIDCGTIIVGDISDNALFSDSGAAYLFEDPTAPTSCGGAADTTPPTIAATRSPAANANGWNNSPVTVSYTASDDESGIDASASDLADDLFGEGAGQSADGTAVDLAGNSATATVTDINVDLTDPVVTPPTDQTVIATSAAGASVTYSVSATDNLSGVASLVSSPPSGSTFPLGTTAVTHTATDLAGNSSQATHSVTVIGAQGLKNGAIANLTPFEGESKKIKKAIKEINKSLEAKLWDDEIHLDAKHGHKVFDREKHAVKELMKVVKDEDKGKDEVTDGAEAAARQAIDDLVAADRLLASVKIQETIDGEPLDPKNQKKVDKELAKASSELDKGDQDRDNGKADKAIDHYKKAWKHAVKAMKEQMKEPKGSGGDDDD